MSNDVAAPTSRGLAESWWRILSQQGLLIGVIDSEDHQTSEMTLMGAADDVQKAHALLSRVASHGYQPNGNTAVARFSRPGFGISFAR